MTRSHHRLPIHCVLIALQDNKSIDVSTVKVAHENATDQRAHSDLRDRDKRNPTWLEHTLEIKDDQNKRSQTCGEYHPANPAHPHQFEQSLFHGSRRLCWMLAVWSGGRFGRSAEAWCVAVVLMVILAAIVRRSMSSML